MWIKAPLSWVIPLLAALALLASACGDDDDTDPTPGDGTPTATAGGPTASPSATEGCVPGEGPPATGSGPAGLPGRITFVRLVFGCQPDIYIMDGDGSGATPIADDPALDDESDLSTDGSKVVFFSGRAGNSYIYVMNADGSDLQQLTDGPGGDVSPRWSPDGSLIAFSRSGTLMTMNADGTDQKVIMEAQPSDSAEPCRAGAFVGSWAPDGQRITYYSAIVRAAGQASSFWVCAINKDGTGIEVLVGEPEGKLHAEPYWSPDGTKIVFRDDREGDCSQQASCDYDIWMLDLQTGEQQAVTPDPEDRAAFDIEPAWSPDSQWIIFASNREDPDFDLYVIRPDGTGLQRLLNDPGAKDSYPSWR